MTSAKISGMVSTPGTLDTGLSKVTGTVEKGLCATAQASFASVMEQKTSGYGNQQLTSGNPVGKEPAATTTQPAAVADRAKKLNVRRILLHRKWKSCRINWKTQRMHLKLV